MAQPIKIGLDYFPLNVDIFDDEKVMAISKEFGIKGEIVVIRLLCAIYRNGYFIEWNDLLRNKLQMNMPGVSSELLDTVVLRLVRWGFFDEALFNSTAHVLTSRGIQKRYFLAAKRRKTPANLPYLIVGNGDDKHVSTVDMSQKDGMANSNMSFPKSDEETWYAELLKDQLFIETAAMRYNVTIDEVTSGLANFRLDNTAKTKVHTDFTDFRRHAFDWLRYYLQNKAKETNNDTNRQKQQNRRGANEITATSAQDYTTTF